MFGTEFHGHALWWIFPIIMMVLCFFMMFGRGGSMMCGRHNHDAGGHRGRDASDTDSDMPGKHHTGTSREVTKRG